jgi:hypothetical protein
MAEKETVSPSKIIKLNNELSEINKEIHDLENKKMDISNIQKLSGLLTKKIKKLEDIKHREVSTVTSKIARQKKTNYKNIKEKETKIKELKSQIKEIENIYNNQIQEVQNKISELTSKISNQPATRPSTQSTPENWNNTPENWNNTPMSKKANKQITTINTTAPAVTGPASHPTTPTVTRPAIHPTTPTVTRPAIHPTTPTAINYSNMAPELDEEDEDEDEDVKINKSENENTYVKIEEYNQTELQTSIKPKHKQKKPLDKNKEEEKELVRNIMKPITEIITSINSSIKIIKEKIAEIKSLDTKLKESKDLEKNDITKTTKTIINNKNSIIELITVINQKIKHANQIDNKINMHNIEIGINELRKKPKIEKKKRGGLTKQDLIQKGKTELHQQTKTLNKNKIKNEASNVFIKNTKTTKDNKKEYKPKIKFTINTPLNNITEDTDFTFKNKNKNQHDIEFTYKFSSKNFKISHDKKESFIGITINIPSSITKQVEELHKSLINLNITNFIEESLNFFNEHFIAKFNRKIGTTVYDPLTMASLQTTEGVTTLNKVFNKFTEVYKTFKSTKPNNMELSKFLHYYLQGQKHINNIQMYLDIIRPGTNIRGVVLPELLGEATGTNNDHGLIGEATAMDNSEYVKQYSNKYAQRVKDFEYLRGSYSTANKKTEKTLKSQIQKLKKELMQNIINNLTKRNEKTKDFARKTKKQLNSYGNI